MAETKKEEEVYSYTAVDTNSRVIKGTVEARSVDQVLNKLKAKKLIPIDVKKGSGVNKELKIPFLKKRVKLKDLNVMARQLATMVEAGMTLVRSLAVLESQSTNETLKDALHDVRTDVEGGHTLSEAMSKHEDVFPLLMVSMVAAGEKGGFLDKSLLAVADNFESQQALHQQIKSAMAYPVVVLLIAIVAVNAMVIFIVPVFADMFKSLGGDLPALTKVMVDLNHAEPILLPTSIILVVAIVIWWRKNKNKDSVRKVFDKVKLRIPVFGDLSKKIALSRFAKNLSIMMASAVPIIQALSIVGATSGNWYIEKACDRVSDSVRNGMTLGTAMSREPIFPTMMVQMVDSGDEVGKTDVMLAKNAKFYDDEVSAMTKQLTSLLEPLMIVVLGGTIGFMVIALYLPMFSIYDQITQSSGIA